MTSSRVNRSFLFPFLAMLLLVGAATGWCQEQGGLRLPRIFGDNMVLQSGPSVPIWGWAHAGQEVAVTLGAQTVTTPAGADGKWKLALANLTPNAIPATLRITSGTQALDCQNVLVGDVWLGSGQSNLEFPVGGVLEAQRFLTNANCPALRLFRVACRWADQPQEDCEGSWVVCTPDAVRAFSAALYFFGRDIQDRKHLPLGLIESAMGGTRIEPWTARAGFDAFPLLADYRFSFLRLRRSQAEYSGDAFGKLGAIETWVKNSRKAQAEGKDAPLFPPLYGYGYPEPLHRAAMLYNANIHPLVPYGLRGFVWYQGEANEFEQETYALKMQALVHSWRQAWGNTNLPFYYTQIANWLAADSSPAGSMGYGWPAIRMGQLLALPALAHAGMAVTIDIGDAGDIHPHNKQDVGGRLALWARKNEYGEKDLVTSGPLFQSCRREGKSLRLFFDSTGSGLIVGEKRGLEPVRPVPGGTLKRFAIAGADRQWHWADARIEGKEVVVGHAEVPEPVAVRYAFSMNPEGCNLYNREGLPASLRTDDWPLGAGSYRSAQSGPE